MPSPTVGLLVRPDVADLVTSALRRQLTADFLRCGELAAALSFDEFWLEEPPSPATPSVGPFALLGNLGATTTMAVGGVLPATSERIPSITAKLTASLDVVTAGRAMIALAPSRPEVVGPTAFTARDLEAARIVDTLLREEAASVSGDYYVVTEAWNEPRVPARVTPLFLVVAHSGETPRAPTRREFVSYSNGQEVVIDGGAPATHAAGPRRTIVAIDGETTPATIATNVEVAAQRADETIVFEWKGPLDPARLEAVFAPVLFR